MNISRHLVVVLSATLAVVAGVVVHAADDKAAASAAPKPALTVTTTQPQTATWPLKITANGNIAAWQEASIGTEANGLRLAEVRVGVGDVVKRGQVLATFAPDMMQADLNQTRASVAEAEATLAEAAANAQRARELATTGALSAQQINQYLTAERTAQARLDAMRAAAKMQQLRLQQTKVLASDDGVISSRSATVGAVLPAGQELFRLIRQGRLEWRAEVPAAELARLKVGMNVSVSAAGAPAIAGKLRMVAPTVDDKTRNGLVFVDLAASPLARAGMFARGEFDVGSGQALTLPQSAVLLRDGFNYVLKVGPDSKVSEAKVTVGRRVGEKIEILGGIDPAARVVASGGGFLADGDTVRVVDTTAKPAVKAAAAAAVSATK
ncbi:MAG: efflux RND transporter periplasmic adaptor subunit [Betaproteobacteria bacterium]|nr:MAG: efflux RND transporter periplasmic adaptor subunit [Betaproteobacteria bacterium]TMH34512.1 MAG: efflux RND transporter periplasmic adaptor subunit [Betaproteobacteria bacterium]